MAAEGGAPFTDGEVPEVNEVIRPTRGDPHPVGMKSDGGHRLFVGDDDPVRRGIA
jgi:hypothetical protein